jgi:23S rRNA pseudouridine1911/1915/1917 synthase
LRKTETYQVPKELEERVRLSDFIGEKFVSIPSRKGMKKAIDKGLVAINGTTAKTGDWLVGGETVELFEEASESTPNLNLNIEVLFEDEYLAIVNKPAGIEVSGNKKWTLENALQTSLNASTELGALSKPQAIHRLDFPTSGALLIGKTAGMVSTLNKLFEERQIEKKYHAICIGNISIDGRVETPIDDKASVSIYRVLSRLESDKYGGLNLLELTLETGRRHQLRKHLSSIGNPLLGDHNYGIEGRVMTGNGLYLHASSLKFTHPISEKEIYIQSPLPKKFQKLFP